MIPRVLFVMEDIAPSQYFVYYPLLILHQQKKICLEVNLESRIHNLDEFYHYDLVIFSRNHSKKTLEFIRFLVNSQIPYIFEIDDDLYQLPLDYPDQKDNNEVALLRLSQIIQNATLVRVFSERMVLRVEQLTTKFHKVLPPIFWSLINNSQKQSSRINITYSTSRTEIDPIFETINQSLKIILEKYNDLLEITFWGYHPKDFRSFNNTKFIPFTRNYQGFIDRFSSSGLDIGLAPMSNNLFCQAKTNNKYREYGSCSIAGIYSDVDLYNEVRNGETGLLVENQPLAWVNALSLLIENKDLRDQIKLNTKKDLKNKYSEEDYISNWELDIVESILCNSILVKSNKKNEDLFSIIPNTDKHYHDKATGNLRNILKNRNIFVWSSRKMISFISNYLELQRLKSNIFMLE